MLSGLLASALAVPLLAATVVPEGTTLTVTDATASQYAGGIDVRYPTSKALFKTTELPTMSLTGTGIVEKVSTTAWTQFYYPSTFFGTYNIFGGSAVAAGLTVGRHTTAVETVVVSNAMLTSTGYNYFGEAGGRSVLKVLDGGQVQFDERTEFGSKQGGYGCAVYVDGGDLHCSGSFTCIGNYGHGYLRVGSGTVRLENNVYVANGGWGAGIIEVLGGKLTFGSNGGYFCLAKEATALLHVRGGVVDSPLSELQFPVNRMAASESLTNAIASLVVEDGGRLYSTNTASLYFGTAVDSTGIFCLNEGGVVCSHKIVRAERLNSQAFACLDGGTLEVAANNPSQLLSDFTRATIYSRGFTVDTCGYNYSQKANSPLSCPLGGGVTSVVWTAKQNFNYYARPSIRIRGDGAGAMAVADYDPETRTVKGIRIVSPGNGYTWAKATIWLWTRGYHGGSLADEYNCLVSTSQTGGGLTKRGAGTYTLNAANTYVGDTVVKEGTLCVGASSAIPENSAVLLAGGVVSATKDAFLPVNWAIDCAQGTVSCPGTLAFPSGAALEVRNVPAQESVVELLQAEAIVGCPTLSGTLGKKYNLSVRDNCLVLRKKSGFSVLFR